MSNIITEAVTSLSTVDRLANIPVPARTKSYAPVPHTAVRDLTLEALDKAGIKLIKENYHTTREGKQARGTYIIAGGDGEMERYLIWQNSYDKSLPLGWAIGANVIVCTNGMVRGDIGQFKRKHTGEIMKEYEEAVSMYVNEAGEMFEKLVKDRERMKNIELTKRTSAELIGRMFIEEAIINQTQLGIIKRELDNPSYQYGADNTLWQLYNHTTVALREDHPQLYIKRHGDVHNFFTNEYAICS